MSSPTLTPEFASAEMPYNRLRTALMLFGKPLSELDSEQVERVYAQAEKEYQIEQTILESPEAAGVVVSEEELARAVMEVREKYSNEEEFQQSLESIQLDENGLRQALARQCKVNTILDKIDSAHHVVVEDVEIAIYYHAHFDKFQQPERRDAYHILISINEDFPENSRPKALERIMAIVDKLERKPKQFEELAGRYSECPTAMRGGRIGMVRRGQLFPELDQALFQLKPGQMSKVLESEMGFHVLLCKSISPPQTLSLKKAESHIRKVLTERTRESRRREWIAGLLPLNQGKPTS